MEKQFKDSIVSIQSGLKAPKNQRNTFGNYNYRSAEDILEAVKPLLREHSLILSIEDEIVMIGDRYYVKATATISNGSESISTTALAREEEHKKGQDSAQVTGATSSYARKYALNGLLCIDDTKDPDSTNDHGASDSSSSQGAKPAAKAKMKAPAAKKADDVEKDMKEATKALSLCKDSASIDEVVRVFRTLWQNDAFKEAVASRRSEIDG